MLPHRSQLQQRYASHPGFRDQMLQTQTKYKQILQRSLYSDLSSISPKVISEAGKDQQQHSLFFVFGRQQPSNRKCIDKLYMYIIRYMEERIDKKEFQPYSIVYFNTCCGYSNYSTFKSLYSKILPMKYLIHLKRIIIVDPSFTVKAMEWFVTGTVNKMLYNISAYITSFKELKTYSISMSDNKLKLLPNYIKENKNAEISRMSLRESIQTKIKDTPKKINKTKKLKIQQYEVNEVGIPVGLYLMVSYFMLRKQGLKEEGLFRKSVVKQEVDEAMEFVKVKYYDFLEQITNPHIVANLITRFIGDFEQPLIPYSVYNKFVHDEGKSSQIPYIKQVFQVLPSRNHVTLLYLFDFLLDQVVPLKEWNKMTTYNLAVVLAPCLLRSGKEVAIEELMYSKKLVIIMEFVLNNYVKIFGGREERMGVFRRSARVEKKRFIEEKVGGKEEEEKEKQEGGDEEYDAEEAYFDMNIEQTDSVYGEQEKKEMKQELEEETKEVVINPKNFKIQQKQDQPTEKLKCSAPICQKEEQADSVYYFDCMSD